MITYGTTVMILATFYVGYRILFNRLIKENKGLHRIIKCRDSKIQRLSCVQKV